VCPPNMSHDREMARRQADFLEPHVGTRPAPLFPPRSRNVTFDLADADHVGRWVNLVFGAFNLAIMVALLGLGTALLIMAIAPSAMTGAITNHKGPLSVLSRLSFAAGAAIALLTLKSLGKRFEDIWRWSNLQTTGDVVVNDLGITVNHDAVLTTGVFLPWDRIQVVAFDDGSTHDTATNWHRFPVLPDGPKREFLFSTNGEPVHESVLIASRPTAPNMVIVLTDTVALHNPHIDATDAAFPVEAMKGMPSRPPHERSDARILFLRATNVDEIRRTVSISGKVRGVHKSDLPGLFLDRITRISNNPDD
jgi:hypothetical protein